MANEKQELQFALKEIESFIKMSNIKAEASIRGKIHKGDYHKAAIARADLEMLHAIINCERSKIKIRLMEIGNA